jgi:ATP-dependent RNA helicase DeaD
MALKQIEKATKSKIKRREIPTVDEIFTSKYKTMVSRIKETLDQDGHKRFIPLVTELDEEYNLVEVAAALMDMLYSKELSYEYTENAIGGASEFKRLFLSVGRMDRLNPKTLLEFFNETASVNREDVGDIDILEKFSFVNVTPAAAESIIKHCIGKKFNGRKLNIEISTKARA